MTLPPPFQRWPLQKNILEYRWQLHQLPLWLLFLNWGETLRSNVFTNCYPLYRQNVANKFLEIFFCLGSRFLYAEIFLHYYTMILQRIRIIVRDAGFEPRTSVPENWIVFSRSLGVGEGWELERLISDFWGGIFKANQTLVYLSFKNRGKGLWGCGNLKFS